MTTTAQTLVATQHGCPVMRLNAGCGSPPAQGWVNVDRAPTLDDEDHPCGTVRADITERIPFDDETFDYAVAHHVLEQVTYERVVPALAELRRVLVPEGVLRISVPSLLGAVRAHARGDAEWFPAIVGDETSLDGRFCAYLTWYGTARTVFTPSWLAELCIRAGFEFTAPASHGHSPIGGRRHPDICELDSRQHESIYLEASR